MQAPAHATEGITRLLGAGGLHACGFPLRSGVVAKPVPAGTLQLSSHALHVSARAAPMPAARHRRDWLPIALVLLTILLRLPGLGRPLVGNFATKAAVYGMIARNFARGEAHVLYPQLDLLVGGHPSYHLLECPLSAYATGAIWRLCGGSLDGWGRLTSVLWSALAVAMLYALLRRWHGTAVAAGGALALALSPVGIIYGQSFQLEASVLGLSAAVMLGLDRWAASKSARWLWLAAVSGSGLFLTKLFMLYLLPVLACVVWKHQGWKGLWQRRLWLAVLLAVLPATAWYGHVYLAAAPAEGGTADHRVYFSLQRSWNAHGLLHPLLASPGFYKGLLDDLAGVVLTPIGLALLLLALCRPIGRVYAVWLMAAALLVFALPRKFHEMNYYWLAMLPLLCALAGRGFGILWHWLGLDTKLRARPAWRIAEHASRGVRPIWQALLGRGLAVLPSRPLAFLAGSALLWAVFSLRWSVTPAFGTPAEDRGVLLAARAVQRISRSADRVVTVHGTSLDLLYHTDRKGWTLRVPAEGRGQGWGARGQGGAPSAGAERKGSSQAENPSERLEELIAQGAAYLVVAGLESLRQAPAFQERLKQFHLVDHGADYVVYRLRDAGAEVAAKKVEAGRRGADAVSGLICQQ